MPFKKYLDQDYKQLKQQCLESGELFEDDKFPPVDASIFKLAGQEKKFEIIWKRPQDIIENPQFIVDGINPNDLAQGNTGNCWFISAAASLAYIPQYFKRVIPENQSFESNNYAGIFHFRFWQFGEWVDVVIDDFLPTTVDGKLVYCHNRVDENEFFGSLLEKAYAKLYGCYEFLNGGNTGDSMTDLTGAICEYFNLEKCAELTYDADNSEEIDENEVISEASEEGGEEEDEEHDDSQFTFKVSTDLETLWTFILRSLSMNSMMNASFGGYDPNSKKESLQENGLFSGHAYSIMQAVQFGIKRTNKNRPKIRLLKLRNPHGNENPWKGRWSIQSNNWQKLSPQLKEKYQLSLDNFGEFYMSFDDFIQNFANLVAAHVNPDAYFDPDAETCDDGQDWKDRKFFGQWVSGFSSGEENYWNNSQYLIKVNEKSEEVAPVLASLMQPYDIERRIALNGVKYFEIKFHAYSVICDESKIEQKISDSSKFDESEVKIVDATGEYVVMRQLSRRFNLGPGYFVIIPTTRDASINLNYLVRFFYDKNSVDVFQLCN